MFLLLTICCAFAVHTVNVKANMTSFGWFLGEVIAVVGSCDALGSWCHKRAIPLQPNVGSDG